MTKREIAKIQMMQVVDKLRPILPAILEISQAAEEMTKNFIRIGISEEVQGELFLECLSEEERDMYQKINSNEQSRRVF